MNRFAAAFLFAAGTMLAPARADTPLQTTIDAALRAPTLNGAHVGILAIDTATGAPIYARNPDDAVLPASVFKLLTGSVALERLGPAFAFRTEVASTGAVSNGTLQSSLYLRGGGDVQLTRADLSAAAAALAAAGIARVCCGIVADASRYIAPRYPAGWSADDLPYGYAAVPGALGLQLNVAHVQVAPGPAAGAPAHLVFDIDPTLLRGLTIRNDALTGPAGSEDTTDLELAWDASNTVRVVGNYPLGAATSDDLEPAIRDPEAFALDAFTNALVARGIQTGVLPRFDAVRSANATVRWSHDSQPLSTLLRDFWQPSTNLLGEQLLLELGARDGANAAGDTRERGIQVENDWLKSIGIDPQTVTVADGSGLSAYDRISPRTLVAILQHDWQGADRDVVLASLPQAGVSGTLRSRFTQPPLRGALFAKTGSENHTRTLAGYLHTPSGGWVTFALTIDDWMDASPQAGQALDAVREAILTALAQAG